MPLFAQFQPQPRNNDIPPELLPVLIGIVCVFLAIGLVIAIFFLLTLSKALSRCRPANRTMEPGMVWLNFVPLLSLVWEFITVIRVAESLKNEYYDRGWDDRGDFGKNLGLATCILNLLGIVPFIGGLFSLAGLVCFVIYWVKVAGYSKELAERGGDYDDDFDDRPKKRRKRDDDDDYDDDRR
jgi:hypothetical protein